MVSVQLLRICMLAVILVASLEAFSVVTLFGQSPTLALPTGTGLNRGWSFLITVLALLAVS